MSILRSPDETVRFQPRTDGPTFLLRVPTVYDRSKWRKEIRRTGARYWSPSEIADSLARGINETLATAQETNEERVEREGWLASIEGYKARIREVLEFNAGDDPEEGNRLWREAVELPQELLGVFEIMSRESQQLSDRLQDNLDYRENCGIAAVVTFCTGWEGGGLPSFRRTREGADPALLRYIKSEDFIALGDEAARLIAPDEEQAKNSDSESGGSATQTPPES